MEGARKPRHLVGQRGISRKNASGDQRPYDMLEGHRCPMGHMLCVPDAARTLYKHDDNASIP